MPCPTPRTGSGVGIIVAEAMALVREGLAGLLASWPHGPVREAATLGRAIQLLDDDPAALLLLDLALLEPDKTAALQALRQRFPALRILALAAAETRDGIRACLAAGAHGYIAKTAPFAELARAISTVHGGGVHVPASLTQPGTTAPPPPIQSPPAVATLTGRQQDVLRLLAEGRSTKDIARTLDLAVSTIKVHLAAVYRTFGARNRLEALCRAGCLATVPRRTNTMTGQPMSGSDMNVFNHLLGPSRQCFIASPASPSRSSTP